MKERPVLFNGEMVRAILAGKKTQTRRPVRLTLCQSELFGESDIVVCFGDNGHSGPGFYMWSEEYPDEGSVLTECPFGVPGDTLWVRETFCPIDDREFGEGQWVDYRATPRYDASHPGGWHEAPDGIGALKWRPSIHMPREFSRITLEVTSVRVERLQAITEADAQREGAERPVLHDPSEELGFPVHPYTGYYRDGFAKLWDGQYGNDETKRWDANPWVWVMEFKRA